MAKTIKGITIELEGKTSGLVKSLAEVDKQLKETQDALKQVDQALDLDPKNVDLVVNKQKVLNEAIDETRKKLELEQEAAQKASEALDAGNISQSDYATVISQVTKTTDALEKLEAEAEETDKALEEIDAGEIDEVGDAADKSAGKMGNLKTATGELKKALEKVSSMARQFVSGSMQSYMDYEDAFTGVTKTVDETANTSYEDISAAIKEMAGATGVSKQEIAGVAEAAGQLGISADDLVDFTKVMVDMGVSTNLSSENAASSIAKLFNVLKEDMSNVDRAGSAIVDLGNNFATTENDIVSMATRLAATGAVVGLSTDQILAISTALSSVGIEAEAGGSAMSKLLKQMAVAVERYKAANKTIDKTGKSFKELVDIDSEGADGLKDVAAAAGLSTDELKNAMKNVQGLTQYAKVSNMTAEQFSKAYGENAVSALGAFINGLGAMDEQGESSLVVLEEMGIKEVRLSNAVLALAGSDDILTKATETASAAWENNNALQEEAQKRYDTTSQKIKGAQEEYDNLKIEIGEKLLPILSELLDIVKDVIDWFSNLDEGTLETIAKFALLVAAIGPVISAISGAITIISSLSTVLSALSLASATSPVVLAIAAFGALALEIKTLLDLYHEWEITEEARRNAERISNATTKYKNETLNKMIENPYEGLWADEGTDARQKADAAYRLMGLDPDEFRAKGQPVEVTANIQVDSEVLGSTTVTAQQSRDQRVLGGS